MSENHKIIEIIKKDMGDILECDFLDINSDISFFELGFHSLNAIQIVNKIKNRFNIDIPFVAFFDNDTVNKMAELIQNTLNEKS